MFTQKFIEVMREKLAGYNYDNIFRAKEHALKYLEDNHLVSGTEEEYKQFRKFYSDVVKKLG